MIINLFNNSMVGYITVLLLLVHLSFKVSAHLEKDQYNHNKFVSRQLSPNEDTEDDVENEDFKEVSTESFDQAATEVSTESFNQTVTEVSTESFDETVTDVETMNPGNNQTEISFEEKVFSIACVNTTCACCGTLSIRRVRFKRLICIKLSYIGEITALQLSLTVRNKIIMSITLSAFDPPPMCVGLPSTKYFTDLCFDFYKLQVMREKFNVCLNVVPRVLLKKVKKVHVACLTFERKKWKVNRERIHGVHNFTSSYHSIDELE